MQEKENEITNHKQQNIFTGVKRVSLKVVKKKKKTGFQTKMKKQKYLQQQQKEASFWNEDSESHIKITVFKNNS